MKIAAAYIRVSTEDQVEYSPASQLEKIQEYAKRNGYILPAEFVYTDEGISGRTAEKRPAFNAMIGMAKTKPKPFDAILLWKFSRFARNREDSIVYKSMLRKQCGIDVISISENVGDDKMSVLIEAMIEAMDEYYSINLAEEVKRGMTEKVNRGEAVTIPSFGYDIKDGIYIPNPKTAPIVKEIFSKYLSGIPMRTISIELNEQGIKTRRGNMFENRNIEYILNNPVYIGKIRWTPTGKVRRDYHNPNTVIIDGHHEPIIDIETWNAVQKKLHESNKKTKYMRDGASKRPFMLQGLVRCNACGATLCMASLTLKSLQCCGYSHGKCNISHSITIKKLDKMVLESIEQSIIMDTFKLNIRNKSDDSNKDNAISSKIAKEVKKLERAKEAYEDGVYTLEEYKASKISITTQIEKLKSQLSAVKTTNPEEKREALRNKVLNILPALRSPATPETEKNQLIKSFLERVIFYKPSGDIDLFFYI